MVQSIEEEVRECRRCSLWRTRTNAVPGEGNPDSSLVFIGEAPGYREDLEGRPFVGAAGRILDEILERVGLLRTEVYVTNILKCRPPGNRDPRAMEVEACTPCLDRQLRVICPWLVVTLGRHSTAYIFSKSGLKFRGITEARGRTYEIDLWGSQTHVFPTFHPAAALYNVQLRGDLERDLGAVKRRLESLGRSG